MASTVQRSETTRSLTFVIGDLRQRVQERSTSGLDVSPTSSDPSTRPKNNESKNTREQLDLMQHHHKPGTSGTSKSSVGTITTTVTAMAAAKTSDNVEAFVDESGTQLKGLALERAVFRSRLKSTSFFQVRTRNDELFARPGTIPYKKSAKHGKEVSQLRQTGTNMAQEEFFINESSPESSGIGDGGMRLDRLHQGLFRRRASTNCVQTASSVAATDMRLEQRRSSLNTETIQPLTSVSIATKNTAAGSAAHYGSEDSVDSLMVQAASQLRNKSKCGRRHTVPEVHSIVTPFAGIVQVEPSSESGLGSNGMMGDESRIIRAARRRILSRLSRGPEPEKTDLTTVTDTELEAKNNGCQKSTVRKPRKLDPLVTDRASSVLQTQSFPVGHKSSITDVTGNNDSLASPASRQPLIGRRGKALLPGVGK